MGHLHACLFILTKPASAPRTLSRGLTVRPLLCKGSLLGPCCQGLWNTRACLNTKRCMHARLAQGSSLGACSAKQVAEAEERLGSGVEERRVHRHGAPIKARGVDLMP